MGNSKYIVKKKKPTTKAKKTAAKKVIKKKEKIKKEIIKEEKTKEEKIKEEKIKEEILEEDPTIKVIRISTEKQTSKQTSNQTKIVVNMIPNQVNESTDNDDNDNDDNDNDDGCNDECDDGDFSDDEVVVKKQPEASKECVQLAIKILRKIDPKRQMKKEDVTEILREYKNQVNDLMLIQAIEYLLDSFENLEEKLEEFEEYRKVQEDKLKGTKLDKKIFHDRINLDLDKKEREPDENDRIYRTGKKVFSGNNQKYKKAKATEINRFRKLTAPKRDHKLLKKYNI